MIRIFVDDISSIKSSEEFDKILLTLPEYRKKKIFSLKFDQDKQLSLLAGKLLQKGLVELGFENFDQKIVEDENGKPYIPGNPVYFSISHSGTKAMVVISDVEVGCDIQIVKNKEVSIADKFFTENECKEIKNSENPETTFYKMWTLKESFMKLTGKGLSYGLKNINVENCKLNIDGYTSYFWDVGENYVASYILKGNKINLIFDCDGTLIDSYAAITDNIAKAFEACGVFYDRENIRKLCIYHNVDYCLQFIASEKNVDYNKAFEEFERIPENTDLIAIFDGCKELLSNPNFNCFVYTHRGLSCLKIFSKLGIKNMFTEIVNSSYGFKFKPNPEGVEYLVNKYGLDKNNTYYVGDRIIDIECGNNAGVRTIFFNSSGLDIDYSKADFVVFKLNSISKLPL